MEPTDDDDADSRDTGTVRYDLLVDQVNALVAKMDDVLRDGRGHKQTVIHKSEGVPALVTAVAAGIGLSSMVLCVAMLVWVVPEIHDLRAWNDQLRMAVAALKSSK